MSSLEVPEQSLQKVRRHVQFVTSQKIYTMKQRRFRLRCKNIFFRNQWHSPFIIFNVVLGDSFIRGLKFYFLTCTRTVVNEQISWDCI